MKLVPPKRKVHEKKVVSFRISGKVYEKLERLAKKHGYSRNGYVEWLLTEAVKGEK